MEDSTKAEIIKGTTEIVKTAYEDAFKPVAQETGKALGTLGKTVNVALFPLKAVVWGYDQIEAFIHEKVTEKLEAKGVKEEDILTPDPDVAVPTIEALRYSKLKDEFATLLASAMDSNTADKAHPAFVDILKQMKLIDAQTIKLLPKVGYIPILQISKKTGNGKGYQIESVRYGGVLAAIQEKENEHFLIAMDNLVRLGIVEVSYDAALSDETVYEQIRKRKISNDIISSIPSEQYTEQKGIVKVTEFGKSFKEICT